MTDHEGRRQGEADAAYVPRATDAHTGAVAPAPIDDEILRAYLADALPAGGAGAGRRRRSATRPSSAPGSRTSARTAATPASTPWARSGSRARLTCPSRQQLGSYLLDALDPELAAYLKFHLEVVECPFCQANLADLEASQAGHPPPPPRPASGDSSRPPGSCSGKRGGEADPVFRSRSRLRGFRRRHRGLLGVAPVGPAEVVVPRRQAEALQGEGVDRGAAAPLAVGDDRLARLDAQLLEPGPQRRARRGTGRPCRRGRTTPGGRRPGCARRASTSSGLAGVFALGCGRR